MKRMNISIRVFFLVLISILGWTSMPVQAGEFLPEDDNFTYLPLVTNYSNPVKEAIVVDHRHTDISKIPPEWIGEVKNFLVHYAHTSHGSQVLTGLYWLEERDATYNVDIEASGVVVKPGDTSALRVYDGNNYTNNTYECTSRTAH